jgi:hypothetical protein
MNLSWKDPFAFLDIFMGPAQFVLPDGRGKIKGRFMGDGTICSSPTVSMQKSRMESHAAEGARA